MTLPPAFQQETISINESTDNNSTDNSANNSHYFSSFEEIDAVNRKEAEKNAAKVGAIASTLNSNVMPNLRVLLGETLRAINASIPNKEQNRSVTEIIREAFDRAYFDIYGRAFPDCTYGQSGGYALTPEPNRAKAFADCLSIEK
jgi:hypothetical protein